MSAFMARAKVKIFDLRPSFEISLMAWKSCSDTAGMPASIRSTPISASFSAIATLSATLKTTPGVCSPSRSVAS